MTDKLRVALLGADSLLMECGERLLAGGHDIVVVAAGSARVLSWAERHDLATVDASGSAAEWARALADHQFDWLFAITHLHIVPDDVLAMPAKGAINFHDGPLPGHRGLNTPAFALVRGDATWGITWHRMTAAYDQGDILVTRSFEIAPGETSLSLNTRNFEAALDAFDELVSGLAEGTLRPVAQPGGATLTDTRRSDRPAAAGVLDWRAGSVALDRLVRALNFGPYPNPITSPKLWGPEGLVAVTALELVDDDTAGAPGEVLAVDPAGIVVQTADGAVRITECTSLRGVSLSPADAATTIGAGEGNRLPLLDDDRVAALDAAMQSVARVEPARLADLVALEPVEVPWASMEGAPGSVVEFQAVDVWPNDDAAVAAAFAIALARVSGKARFHVAAVCSDISGGDELVASLVETWRPLAIDVPNDAPLELTRRRLAAAAVRASESAPFPVDLVGRQPALASNPALQLGRSLPTAIRIDQAGEPADGVVVELERLDGRWRMRFDATRIDRADADVLVAAIRAVTEADGADDTVTSVDLLGPDLRALVLDTWNDTAVAYETDVSIHELVERQAQRTPDATALVCEGQSLSYAELDDRTNRLAHHLVGLGVGREDLVGVHVDRSIDLVVAALGVLKAGAAYVPLDPTYPHDRLTHMIRDSGCRVIVTESALAVGGALPASNDLTIVQLDTDRATIDGCPATRPDVAVTSDQVAYCIYTSGSTGLPKGVLVEHRNVVNFFVGMDDRVPHELPATWYAVTSLSFDISVLELFYTLTRGFTVVIHVDHDRSAAAATTASASFAHRPMDFSLFYFSGDAASEPGPERYRLLLDGARFADANGFRAVWTPERHFHSFGGLFPEPAVTGAAVAAITSNVQIRAGSVVMPLHHPARVAEAWSVVDNISGGRVGISVASGWQPNDFVLFPENYASAKQKMFDNAELLRRLWRGEAVDFDGPLGSPVEVRTLPSPVQPELPLWVTTAGTLETYIQAGRIGANVLTHLLGQSIEQLAPKIEAYRSARAEAGHDPDAGIVTLMLHTFVGEDEEAARAAVREPLKQYLATSFSLLKEYAWSFPAFARPAGSDPSDLGDDEFKALSADDLDAVLEFAFLRYYETSGLFGSSQRCLAMVDRLKAIGVNEIACLVDFGVDTDSVLASLPQLTAIKDAANARAGQPPAVHAVDAGSTADEADDDYSVAAQIVRHGVTHLQCTPSMARMFTLQDDTRAALKTLRHMFVGGEALPTALANELVSILGDSTLTNMYGPTETTIWSTTWPVPHGVERVVIGTPIANTSIYVLDRHLQPMLPGVPGDLWIGGDGVVRGYHERPELTAERFVADPHRGAPHRMYSTGDLARWVRSDDGTAIVEFLGRVDHQVKVRGYRIELGEIETQLGRYPGVRENVVVVRVDDGGDQQLVAFVSAAPGSTIEPAAVRDRLRETLPEVMVPAHIVVLDDLPHTPNGKIDRNGLPALADVQQRRRPGAAPVAAGSDTERQVLAVWHEVLGNTDVGVNDNFFDVGGHSLLVVRMHRRLKERLVRPVALTDLYRFPTVRAFAAALEADGDSSTVQTGLDRAQRRRQRRGRV